MKGTSTRLEGIDWFLRIFFVPLPLSCPILAMISVWVWAVLFVFLASPFLYPLWIRIFFFALPNNNNTHTHHDVLSQTASRPIQWRAVFSFFVLFSIPINALYLPVCEYATPTPNPTLASCPRFVLTDGIFWPFSFIHSISSPFRAASFLVHLFRCVGLVRFSLTQKINFSWSFLMNRFVKWATPPSSLPMIFSPLRSFFILILIV